MSGCRCVPAPHDERVQDVQHSPPYNAACRTPGLTKPAACSLPGKNPLGPATESSDRQQLQSMATLACRCTCRLSAALNSESLSLEKRT